MKKILLISLALAIILTSLAAAFPDLLLNPGPLMQGHHALEKKCLSCHKPFAGVTSAQCITCHKRNDIGVRNVAGAILQRVTPKARFHSEVGVNSCLDCHTDHRGIEAKKTFKQFKHESLSLLQQKECITCHTNKKPQDAMHRFAKGSCSECHGTKKWKPATFDHKKLTDSSGLQCISCHKADQPQNTLHLNAQGNCASCHSTSEWIPATFNHDRYFLLEGNHRFSCTICHTRQDNYKSYTCYNCHEHSQSRIAFKHLKEGISNYQNCIKCHRSGSEDGEGKGGDKDDD